MTLKRGLSKKVRSSRHMLVACFFESATHEEVLAFIDAFVPNEHDYCSVIYEGYSKPASESAAFLLDFLKMIDPDFDLKSDEVEALCKAELAFQLERLLSGEIPQEQFCAFLNLMENYVNFHDVGGTYFFGDLYNCCDVFDENWKFLPNDYLIEEAQRVRDEITEGE